MNSKIITLRTVFERADVLCLLNEPEFGRNLGLQAQRDVKPLSDHFLAVFVFEAESREDGSLLLRAISTTVVGIQRFTTKRLWGQGIFVASSPTEHSILWDTLRSHYQGVARDHRERMKSLLGPKLRWTMSYPNYAGDLASPAEFVMEDPDLAELEKLLNPDPRPEDEDGPGG